MRYVNKLFILALAICVGFSSCKKDEEEEVLPSITGEIDYILPAYALVGESFNLKAVGVTSPETGIKYSWVCSGIIKDTLKTPDISISIPDSLATYSVKLTVSAAGYYSRTVTKNVVSVNPGFNGSIVGVKQSNDSIKDMRDGRFYHYVEIGNLLWFSENLKWEGAGAGYAKADAMGRTMLGRLYTWKDATGGVSKSGLGNGAQGICPDGWSIPTNEDWMDLAKNLNDGKALPFVDNWKGLGEKVISSEAKFNGTVIWPFSGNTNPTNKFGWNALAAGSCTNDYNNYTGIFSYGFWWSSTELSASQANYRYVYYDQPDFPLGYTGKDGFGASVRCVKLK